MNEILLVLLMGAKTQGEFKSAVSDGSAIEALRVSCSQEIDLKVIPRSCFQVSKLEYSRKMISTSQFETKSRWLDGFCKKVARESHDLNQMQKGLDAEVSERCRLAVQNRLDDLSYQLGEVRELDQFLK